MYSGEYDACDITLSVYPHRASLKNMPDHGGNRTYDLWNTSPMLCQLSYAVWSPVPFLRNLHWGGGGGGGAKQEKRQKEKYEPSRFGERASLKRDFVKL